MSSNENTKNSVKIVESAGDETLGQPNNHNDNNNPTRNESGSEATSGWGFCTKGATLTLHHRNIRNRHLKVSLDVHPSVAECRPCKNGSDVANSTEVVNWSVPCDITGLCKEVESGTKAQKKAVRVRVHPETLKMAAHNEQLARKVDAAAKELIEQILGSNWSLTLPNLPSVRLRHVRELQKLFTSSPGYIDHCYDSVVVSWPFEDAELGASLCCSSVISALSLRVFSADIARPKKKDAKSIPLDSLCPSKPASSNSGPSNPDKTSEDTVDKDKRTSSEVITMSPKGPYQNVQLRFAKDVTNEPLLELRFVDNEQMNWISTQCKDHTVELDRRGVRVCLYRTEPDPDLLPVKACDEVVAMGFDDKGTPSRAMLIDVQKRVEVLHRRLEESLAAYQQRQQKSIASSYGHHGTSPSSKGSRDHRRPLEIVFQDKSETLVLINGRLPVSYAPIAEGGGLLSSRGTCASSSAPLKVFVGQAVSADATTIGSECLASSPAGSVDSGVSSLGSSSSSPFASPGSSPVYARESPFQKHCDDAVLRMRQRSTSESCSSTTGLKSILKKTYPVIEYKGRFTRSISECQNGGDERDSVTVPTVNNEVLDEEDEDTENLECEVISRKKRVSFSERLVQERSFRPNSSILGQKKKNQRKMKNKLKKRASEDGSTDDEAKLTVSDEVNPEKTSTNDQYDEQSDEKLAASEDLATDHRCFKLSSTVPTVDDAEHDDAFDTVDADEREGGDENCCAAMPVAGKLRERVLRGSTGEEISVMFMMGDTEITTPTRLSTSKLKSKSNRGGLTSGNNDDWMNLYNSNAADSGVREPNLAETPLQVV